MTLEAKLRNTDLSKFIREEARDNAFYSALRAVRDLREDLREVGGWHLYDGMIRTGMEHEFCPITAVCNHREKGFFAVEDAAKAAKELGIDAAAMMVLVASADLTVVSRPTVREALLRATGIVR